jgi:hypothetical protein
MKQIQKLLIVVNFQGMNKVFENNVVEKILKFGQKAKNKTNKKTITTIRIVRLTSSPPTSETLIALAPTKETPSEPLFTVSFQQLYTLERMQNRRPLFVVVVVVVFIVIVFREGDE